MVNRRAIEFKVVLSFPGLHLDHADFLLVQDAIESAFSEPASGLWYLLVIVGFVSVDAPSCC